MADLARVKRNVAKMAGMNAPESEIDDYIRSEGTTVDAVRTFNPMQGQQVYSEQAGPPKRIAGGGLMEEAFGTLAEDPSGGLTITPPTNPYASGLGDSLLRGGIGGLRDLAVGVARAPIDLAPPLVAVLPGLMNEAMGRPAEEDPGIQAIAQFQRMGEPFADSISKTIPEVRQNTTLGDIVQGVTPYAVAGMATGGGSILNTMLGGALGDALATDPNKASTAGDVFGFLQV